MKEDTTTKNNKLVRKQKPTLNHGIQEQTTFVANELYLLQLLKAMPL